MRDEAADRQRSVEHHRGPVRDDGGDRVRSGATPSGVDRAAVGGKPERRSGFAFLGFAFFDTDYYEEAHRQPQPVREPSRFARALRRVLGGADPDRGADATSDSDATPDPNATPGSHPAAPADPDPATVADPHDRPTAERGG